MRQRLKAAGLALVILVLGLGLVVAATEHEARADAAGQRLLTMTDVARAFQQHDIVFDDNSRPAHHPLLGVSGTTLTFGASSVEVFIYSTVADRVADEQIIQRLVIALQSFVSGDGGESRITSARNVLMLYHAESAGAAAAIQGAARSLTVIAES